jgi:ATP-dependent DNA helicase DinG
MVSVSPAECVGKRCPLADICLPAKAKEAAQEADIIVTNHSMIAVQAATGAKVVLGNSKVGDIDIVVIDEAHALPNIVRNQGKGEVSAGRIFGLVRTMNKLLTPDMTAKWAGQADWIAEAVTKTLSPYVKGVRPGDVQRFEPDALPIASLIDGIVSPWIAEGMALADQAKNSPRTEVQLNYKRMSSAFESFSESLDAVNEPRPGIARWVEPPTDDSFGRARPYPIARSAPVDVSSMLRFNVWENRYNDPDTDEQVVEPRTVVAMSATLPAGFSFQVGIKAQPITYESPFEVAYEHSAVYIPMFTKHTDFAENWCYYDKNTGRIVEPESFDPGILGSPGYGGKWKFDTRKHTAWATAQMMKLVERNGGRTLVLSATVGAGKEYVHALRRHAAGRWKVYSQWEGESLRNLVTAWKEDETSVLVGTKSLMTGVDAPGQTASLIVVDRPARAAGNPVDDARVELFMDKMDYSKWDGDRMVYVSDAALLLEQAAGRGIRQVDDVVLIAVLDPRMLKSGTYTYPAPTQKSYMSGLHKFGEKLKHIEDAFDYIDELRERFPSPESVAAIEEPKVIDFAKLLSGKP